MRVLRLAGPDAPWAPAPDGAPSAGQADVWIFDPASVAAGPLTADELARAGGIRRPEPRLRFQAVRATLRRILAGYLDTSPLSVPIAYGPQGKPHLSPEVDSPVTFSVSHSGALAAIAVAPWGEVGVDIELRAPRARMPLLAEALLAPAERDWFERLRPGERTSAFFDLWSAKEACAKLIGRGLTMPFSAIALATPESDYAEVSVAHASAPGGPCFTRRLPVEAGYSGALAMESPPRA